VTAEFQPGLPWHYIEDLLCSRKSVRAFRPDPVSRQQVLDILRLASRAPSNSNTQPWRVHVLAGAVKAKLTEELLAAHNEDSFPPAAHFPAALPERLRLNQEQFGALYYAALRIDRDDASARKRQTGRNFEFFGAPIGLIFSLDCRLTPHSWLDCGLFIQNVMLAARACGLDTCPQVSFVRYKSIIANHLGFGRFDTIVCGMSLGYADPSVPVNSLEVPREAAEQFSTFLGFDLP
jgi:nitroreductase